MTKANSLFLTA